VTTTADPSDPHDEHRAPVSDEPAPVPAGGDHRVVDQRAALAEHRRHVRVRAVASRIVLVIALATLLALFRRHSWRPVQILDQVAWDVGRNAARPTIVLVATCLLIGARGLRRGHRLAWATTVLVLTVSGLLHLTHRFEVVGAVIVLGAAGWLLTQRRAFPVLPSRRDTRRAALVALTGVLAVGAIVAGFAIATDDDPVRRTALRHVSTGITAVLGALFVVVLLWSLTSPHRPAALPAAAHLAERERARALVKAYGGGTLDYFALRDDKDWFFVGRSVVAHSVRGGVCLVSPDPIGPVEERAEVWAEFCDYVASYGWSLAVLGASADWLPVYEASGLRAVYLGSEAIVDGPSLDLSDHAHKGLRNAANRVERAGYVTRVLSPSELDDETRRQVLEIATQSRRGDAERGFSMTLSRLLDPADDDLLLSVTTSPEGRVDAFCQWAPCEDGWSLDVMRRRLDVDKLPNGLMEATVVRTVEEVVRRGGRRVGLNFAVMREVLQGEGGSAWEPLVRPVLQRLSEQTQMSSLAVFNEKFTPAWVPRYVMLDSAEYVATQAVVMAGAEGIGELPVIGRFLAARPRG
jgi:lysyl-tRNA synthetase class 2